MNNHRRPLRAQVWAEQLIQDLRYAFRSLRGAPTFSLVVVLTLAVAIGMNTAIFSVFNAVVLRPIGYPQADRLVWVSTTLSADEPGFVTSRDFTDWRAQARSFDGLVAYANTDFPMVSPQGAARVRAAMVTSEFWDLSGAKPAAGRLPLPAESAVVLLTDGFARRTFPADSAIVGRTIALDGRQVTIVGILPEHFRFQFPGSAWPGFRPREVDLYRPMIVSPPARGGGPMELFSVVGRLSEEATPDSARAELEALRGRRAQAGAGSFDDQRVLRVVPLHDQLIGQAGLALRVMLGAVAFVLLIACANAANLHLARASARRRELAVRMAVGAGRGRVLRQLFIESLVLAAVGSGAGVVLARVGLAAISRIDRYAIPRLVETTIDLRVLAVVLGMGLLTALAFGLAPAFAVRRTHLHDALKNGGQTMSAGASSLRARRILAAGQVALALMLLIGAGLMMKSAWRMHDYPPGFQPERVLMASIEFAGPGYSDPRRSLAFADALLGRMAREPGVIAASISTHGHMLAPGLVLEGEPARRRQDARPPIMINATSAELPRTMGLRLVRGRWFTHGERGAVLNDSLARREMPGRDPIGKRIQVTGNGPWLTIVGIVADLKYSQLDAPAEPEAYVPYSTADGLFGFTALIRTATDPLQLAPTLRRAISDIDSSQVADEMITLDRALAESIAPRRLNLFLLGTFAAAAVFVAMVGVYGVMAYSVTQRTHEMGVRMALGAERSAVVGMIVRQGMVVTISGIAAGLAGAMLLTRFMASLLYDVEPSDPLTFTAVAIGLAVIGAFACAIPAMKAAFLDPTVALRCE